MTPLTVPLTIEPMPGIIFATLSKVLSPALEIILIPKALFRQISYLV